VRATEKERKRGSRPQTETLTHRGAGQGAPVHGQAGGAVQALQPIARERDPHSSSGWASCAKWTWDRRCTTASAWPYAGLAGKGRSWGAMEIEARKQPGKQGSRRAGKRLLGPYPFRAPQLATSNSPSSLHHANSSCHGRVRRGPAAGEGGVSGRAEWPQHQCRLCC
jgi:hypothetical protein